MLRSTVTLSRTVNRQSETSRYSVSLDGEIMGHPDDPESVLERVAELFSLAEEALAREIQRDTGDEAHPGDQRHREQPGVQPVGDRVTPASLEASGGPATPKQIKFLRSLGKRQGLSDDALSTVLADVLGQPVPLSGLTKRQAGQVIDHLNGRPAATTTE
jgi:hypothetical protein